MDPFTKFYSAKEINYATHDLFKYPAKFIPQIAKEFILSYSKENDTIFDLFCGSGTSLLEANLNNRNAIGVDVSPIACLVSRSKTTKIPNSEIIEKLTKIKGNCAVKIKKKKKIYDFFYKLNPNVPKVEKLEYWFQPNMLREISILQQEINLIQNLKLKEFFTVALLQTIKETSKASQFYKLTIKKNPKNYPDLYVPYKFREITMKMQQNMREFQNRTTYYKPPTIFQQDSREKLEMDKVDFVITNIPIFNRDYVRTYKIYHWWIDQFDENKMSDIQKKIIGVKSERKNKEEIYFNNVEKVLKNVFEVLKSEKYFVLKCKDFVNKGQKIESVSKILKIARKVGFEKEKILVKSVPKKAFTFAKNDVVENYLVLSKH